jgi:membrane fusion protein (multidrug efflux system)
MKTKTKIWVVAIIGLLAVIGLLVGIKAGQIGAMIQAGKAFTPPPETVTSARVGAEQWQAARSAIGTLVAVRGVTLAPELAGVVREIGFESGTSVKHGAVLVKLDVATEEAQLAAALADASLAKLTLERAQALRKGGANSQADLDAAEARAKQTEATVASLRTTIAKKTIRAPFDGRISIRQVELGQYLAPGTPIATLLSVTPVHADFWLPQQAIAELSRGQRVRIRTDAFTNASWDGEITAINPEVDPATRNVRVRATFPNPDGRLRSGMFVDVEVLSKEKRDVLTIPLTAVIFAPYGDTVFVLDEKKDENGKTTTVARQTFVRLGERRGDYVAVDSGLDAGQMVVSTGAFKLRNGTAVLVNNALAPEAGLAPKPRDE